MTELDAAEIVLRGPIWSRCDACSCTGLTSTSENDRNGLPLTTIIQCKVCVGNGWLVDQETEDAHAVLGSVRPRYPDFGGMIIRMDIDGRARSS